MTDDHPGTVRTAIDGDFSPVINESEPGDVVYLNYHSQHGNQRIHAVVTETTPEGFVALSRTDDEYQVSQAGEETVIRSERHANSISGGDIRRLERFPNDCIEDDSWREWEVNLCADIVQDAETGEVRYPEASSRGQAVLFARQRSNSSLEAGPVYDMGPPRQPDN